MLNQNDRRRLEEIERGLWNEDPEFARRFTRWSLRGRPSRLWPMLVLVVGVFGMVVSVLTLLPAVFVLSLAGAVAGWVWLRRRDHLDAAGPADGREG